MKRCALLSLVIILALFAWMGCGGAGATTAPEVAPKSDIETAITPTAPAKTPAILTAPEEASAQSALLSGDWIKAYDEYNRLIRQDVKTPLAEYYLYRLLQAADYGAGISGTNVSAIINHFAESPETNENLRALALWFQTNIYIRSGKLTEAATSAGQMGFVQDYLFIGPFENEEETGFNAACDVETELALDKTYTGKQGQNQWCNTAAHPAWG